MNDSLNAIGIIAFILVVVCVRLFKGAEAPTLRRALYATLAATLVALLIRPTHMCNAGDPVSQVGVPAFAVGYAVTFLRDWRYTVGVSLLALGAGWLLCDHYLDLVHSDFYTRWGRNDGALWLWHSPLTGLFGVQA